MELEYFGTSLDTHGHYFWLLCGNSMMKSRREFASLPFNPYDLTRGMEKGHVVFSQIDGYTIMAIEGSCFDKRGGTKTVFFEKTTIGSGPVEFREKLLAHPYASKIIEALPFIVRWSNIG